MCDKELLLDWAEVTDAWRMVPRIAMTAYGYLMWHVTDWYLHLPFAERSVDTTAFIGTVYGIAGAVMGLYLNGGYDWVKRREYRNASKPDSN